MSGRADEMHPEIKKFWEDTGYGIDTDILIGPGSAVDPWRVYWFLVENGPEPWDQKQIRCVGMSDLIPGRSSEAHQQWVKDGQLAPCTIHILNDIEYTEEQMLRIIRLKAFL